ncbi:uncharacterized protein MELLADRAFT_124466 [Melampsora larici-populina 98AG31]|uniref:Secreted protein n=1 Tax=Melampsora larici-populina (strain 98AG31 / pathotype 3-4-7) TaxID=747676 RepID=F4R658_MELLP|nr:uncharacterized protein MELLADRAFT_124466 [Melampsora larici-populina 98AG31]EGG12526.1 secreted protein [Melampsora larici-populina 98AG31]
MYTQIISILLSACVVLSLIQFIYSQLTTTATNFVEFALEELEGVVTDRSPIGNGHPEIGVQRRNIPHYLGDFSQVS